MSIRSFIRTLLAGGILLGACPGAGAEGFRNIATVTADTYFNGDWRLETTEVFLARVVPALTVAARASRVDTAGWNQHLFFLGPVVSFTPSLYLEAVYGLGVDSDEADGRFSHELDLAFNYETEANAASLGLKAYGRPASGYFYFLPSVSGKFHPLPALGLFGKFFLSIDSARVFTESFWGQADYRFSPLFGARAGFTVSHADTFGYSLLAGLDLHFRRAVSLGYTFQFLSDSIELTDLQPRSGISNALMLDVRF